MERTDQPPQQPTSAPQPLRAPLPPQAQAALTRLDKALGMKAATR